MGLSKEFRFQPSSPGTPSDTGVARYWVNTSGILNFTHSNGTSFVAHTLYPLASTTTGNAVAVTGGAILGSVVSYLAVTGPSGQSWVVPAYARTVGS